MSTLTLVDVRWGVALALDARRLRAGRLTAYELAVCAVYGGWLPAELADLVPSDVAQLIDRGELRFTLGPRQAPAPVAPRALCARRRRAAPRRRRAARRYASTVRAGADPPPSEKTSTPGVMTGGAAQNIGRRPRVRTTQRRSA